MKYHIHDFKFESETNNLHLHTIAGYTTKMLGFGTVHFHFFSGVSSYCNHTHYFAGITGLPVKTANGHIHRMEGVLELNILHEHKFDNYTSDEISYNMRRRFSEALI